MHVVFVCRELTNNALGRTYCLWLLARAAGHSTQVITAWPGEVWGPLQGEREFARDCAVFAGRLPEMGAELERADVVVAVKPLPASLGVAATLLRRRPRPLVVDVDDPDLEVRSPPLPAMAAARRFVSQPRAQLRVLRVQRLVRRRVVMTSNPALQARYGGYLVPHVRPAGEPGSAHASKAPSVAFVGTPHPHKGLSLLRPAVARLAGAGFTLVVTAAAPADALPHERWVGATSLADGAQLLRNADIVAVPSLPETYGPLQLPVKVVDGMLAARALVVSDLPPLRWATADAAIVVPPGSVDALSQALLELAEPGRRAMLGTAARTHALRTFTVDAVQPAFEAALTEARRRHTTG